MANTWLRVRTLPDALRQFFRFPSPRVLLALGVLFATVRLLHPTPLSWVDAAILAAVMLYWPIQEWWMHRYLLHLPPVTLAGRQMELGFAKAHRLHHQDPDYLPRVFLPIPVIAVSLLIYTALGWLLTGSAALTCSFMLAAVTSTIVYEWTHYLTHTAVRPRSRWYTKIRRLHRRHHYTSEHHWFSFTVPWIDSWLGTDPPAESVTRSPTAMDLHGLDDAS